MKCVEFNKHKEIPMSKPKETLQFDLGKLKKYRGNQSCNQAIKNNSKQ